jgi:hypothetical protein
MTSHQICKKDSTTGATRGTGTAYPFEALANRNLGSVASLLAPTIQRKKSRKITIFCINTKDEDFFRSLFTSLAYVSFVVITIRPFLAHDFSPDL